MSLDTNITLIKKANSTNAHFGVMGHMQMRAIWANPPGTYEHLGPGSALA